MRNLIFGVCLHCVGASRRGSVRLKHLSGEHFGEGQVLQNAAVMMGVQVDNGWRFSWILVLLPS
jgi:hypothetical protein